MHSGTIEHICVNPDGPFYTEGNRGCLKTYCSANSLKRFWIVYKGIFFLFKRKSLPAYTNLGRLFNHLAFAMRNLNLVIDAPIIISGYLAPYFTEADIDYLQKRMNSSSPFALGKNHILVGVHGQYTPAIGAALFYVEQFIQSI